MSTLTKVKTALKNAETIGLGAEQFLGELLSSQESSASSKTEGTPAGITVTYDPAKNHPRMHGGEGAANKVNGGVIKFSDTQYEIGLNNEADGSVTLVYDSWVDRGLLTSRIHGCNPAVKEYANLKQCQGAHNLSKVAVARGKKVRHRIKDRNLQVFLPSR